MSWIQKLYETYDACAGNETIKDIDELCPVGYSVQNAHIEVVIDNNGKFMRASIVDKNNAKTLIPVTESSSGRTSGESPHPLCDSLQYCAGDYSEYGDKQSYFGSYFKQLSDWCNSELTHEKIKAVCTYVSKKTLCEDLMRLNLLYVKNNKLIAIEKTKEKGKVKITVPNEEHLSEIINSKDLPEIIKLLTADENGNINQAKIFVRWIVEGQSLCSKTWKDKMLFKVWAEYSSSFDSTKGFCYVTGDTDIDIAKKHPAKLRNGKDGAKLISLNDTDGFTYRGRFTDGKKDYGKQTCTVGSIVTQKAHSALRWLIGRKQAFRSDSMVYISWAKAGKPIPDPCANSWAFLGQEAEPAETKEVYTGDAGQAFAERFKKKLAGYKATISDTEDIIVMGLDSATPGRMAITFYRELTGSEFLDRIEKWHSDYAWFQNYSKDIKFTGSPAPKDIAWCAYGTKVEGKNGIKLLNATIERILPCIIDGRDFPIDLVKLCLHRVSNRVGLEPWEFEKSLGITCSMYKGYHKNKMEYQMALEEERKTRDYLYGRLLAVAERIESMALIYAKEKRETTAARLMQRFSDRPFSTWKTIESSLAPYKSRINSKTPGLLNGFMALLDEIIAMFQTDEFILDNRLSGEYLLGYHCQRKWLKEHKVEKGQWILKAADESDTAETEDLELNIN